ncbi:MAG TPA: hypothetical protein VHA76_01430 [Solirubrobacterales bacterium]|nr:hypothetical protein [Solirubrobacterales bacterium]
MVEDSVVATEEAMFVNQFIDNKYAPPLDANLPTSGTPCSGSGKRLSGGTRSAGSDG